MEEHKLRYLQSFIPRTDLSIEELVETVRTWEERARNCYAEPLKLSSHDFVKMMIIDGSFLVELILKFRYPELVGESDRIYKKPRMVYDVVRDMILLENQLPGFVVKAIFGLLSVHYRERIHPEIIHHFFGFVLSMNGFSQGKFISEPDHFIDLIRSRCLPSVPHRSEAQTKKLDTPPAAIELNNAGVRFKLEKTRSYSLDISFANGVITIPTIIIGDLTETLYRNIIAFEQCHYESASDNYFTQYALLLSCFMKSAMDADFLARCGILVNRLGNGEDVSRLFNSIYKEVFVSRFYFQTLSEDLNSYCNKPWNKWKATLRRDYFKNPWSVASVLAAAVLLLLTFTQTVCSILALS
ncbi:PREDICTED: UPF0481 protein At3g47200-like isoform X2 [Tarenaya hassleriana]|nr:PREDICTED: UPF0481 protein At3g47200-like isoform X2 [Tarenaya hassleriana]